MPRTAKRARASGGVGILTLSPDEKRRPLAMMFYNPKTKTIEFDRAAGVGLGEFIRIMRQVSPNYGK